MRDNILIGIDAGTTVFKTAAFDARTGKVLACISRKLPIHSPQPGWQETPVSALDAALKATMKDLRNHLGTRWKQVSGIGVAAQGGSTILIDKTGAPVTNMILWSDTRGEGANRRLRGHKPESWWRKKMLNNWMPAGVGRLDWLFKNYPKHSKHHNTLFVGAGDYLFHALTGRWYQDSGSALQMGTYSPAAGTLDGPAFTLIKQLKKTNVPPIRTGHTAHRLAPTVAARFRLSKDVAVAGPYMDQEAGLHAISGNFSNPLNVSLGTAWVGTFRIPKRDLGFAGLQFVVQGDSKSESTVILPLLTGNTAWDWVIRQFIGKNVDQASTTIDAIFHESLLPQNGMTCVPWLMQPNPVESAYHGAGMFFGVSDNSTSADFIRAVAAGMCFELFRVFQPLKDGRKMDAIILSGGAAKGVNFRAIIATLFAPIPVYVQQNEDTAAARGALVAFNEVMRKSPVKHVPAQRGTAALRIITAYDTYISTLESFAGDHPLGSAYTFAKDSK